MKHTRQKDVSSNSFKAPPERGTTYAKGAKYFTRKKSRPVKELKEEYEK